jgi:subtilisin family serine protease
MEIRENHPFIHLFILVLFFVFACSEVIEEPALPDSQQDYQLLQEIQSKPIEDQYIVVFYENEISFRQIGSKNDLDEAAMRQESLGFLAKYKVDASALKRVYVDALTGFVARINPDQIQLMKADPKVKFIEQDREGELFRTGNPNVSETIPGPNTQVLPWGIKRVGGPFSYNGNRCVFVVDTGINLDHPDLNVNEKRGFDAYTDKKKDWNLNDEHGHGTHVAGIIGALNNNIGVVGVAAGVSLVPVKVFSGTRGYFTFSGILAGLDHIGAKGVPGDVANLSFGGFDESRAIDEAVLNISERKKVWMVIAAGNSGLPATSFSPARVSGPYTITVAAMDSRNRLAWFSHYGPPVKFAAPGVSVYSTWRNGAYKTETGTSMAAPHVAGLRVLGDVETDGYVLNYPVANPAPIAFRR